jgi:chemotaxis-related protein WspB
VIDLCSLANGAPCRPQFDTRILLIDYCADEIWHMLGLVVERVAGMEDVDPDSFFEPGVSTEHAPFLGKVAGGDGSILQLINIEHLLSEDVRAILFPRPGQ